MVSAFSGKTLELPTRLAKPEPSDTNTRLPVPTSQAAACVWLFVRLVALLDPALPDLTDVPEALKVYESNQ